MGGDQREMTERCTDHRKAPRRRGEVLHRAILEAALAELSQVGYAGLNLQRVAARARASTASVYRRWPSRAELVIAAIRHTSPYRDDPPDTGDLREDVLTLLRQAAQALDGVVGQAARGLIADSLRDPELTRVARTRFSAAREALMLDILRRGVERGEVDPQALIPRVATVGPVLVANEFLMHGAPIADEVLVEIVDQVVLPLVRIRPDRPSGCDPNAEHRGD